ncbi:MAG: response regulator, partial [Myxococcales bacterium]|nr:response regulator [Myxococcales bacterium]
FSNYDMRLALGYSVEQATAQGDLFLRSILHPDDWRVVADLEKRWHTATDEMVLESEYRLRDVHGVWRWFRSRESVHARDADGNVTVVAGVADEVTALREAVSRLAGSERRHRALLDSLPDMYFVLDPDGVFVDWHADDHSLLIRRPEEFLNRKYSAVLPPDIAAMFRAGWEARAAGVAVPPIEFTAVTIDGREPVFEGRLAGVPSEQVVVSVRDVTAQRNTERRLRDHQKLEALGRLAGGLAHEFNNALSVIQGATELLYDDLAAGDSRRQIVMEIDQVARSASEMTRQLLAVSRRDAGQSAPVEFAELIERVQWMLRRLIGPAIRLEFHDRAAQAQVNGDRTQLQQVVVNLVVNARDAAGPGGRIVIDLEERVLDAGALQRMGADAAPGRYVELRVTDDGVGMSEEVQRHLFEPFFTTKPVGEGTGLGLAICYGIVHRHGGFFHVRSAVGQGTTITIFLPRLADPELGSVALGGSEPSAPPLPGERRVVLVMEDEHTLRNMLARNLERLGYAVLAAVDGEQALVISRRRDAPIDLLIADVVLPGVQGCDVAMTLRAERPDLAVLLISGHLDDNALAQAASALDACVLAKPFDRQRLARAVRDALQSALRGDASPPVNTWDHRSEG